ncbi:D-alanyl-D-alanine carboxypeptidase family protein [Actinotalea solisilvae]|uniref:D-alanyl-D-alanine carboxypeptidase family protein n=1 Tax=Actinotalea solisilvae TaxID=2072922 RepID=UPI001F4555F5|nr:D-alanyl-D-alanine carboxypeptidase family protein [Actinotalea solisilvae]
MDHAPQPARRRRVAGRSHLRRTGLRATAVLAGLVAVGLLAAPFLMPRSAGLDGAPPPPPLQVGAVPDVGTPDEAAPDDASATAPDPRERDDRIDPFDEDHPAVAGLDPDLRAAVQAAASDAAADGVELWLTSGRRSPEYQQDLLDRATATYGSLEEALARVATPETSSHVTGEAVDVGPTAAADWVGRFGDAYGLCQTYANEMWHVELATTPGGECPAPLPDARG